MLITHLKIAWRSFLKSRAYSFINVSGLALGMSVSLLLGLWIIDEVSFNHYHTNHNHIARVMSNQTFNGKISTEPVVSIPTANEIKSAYGADFKGSALTSWPSQHLVSTGDRKLFETGIWVQPAFPGMFSLKIVKGRGVLTEPRTLLIAASLAHTLFKDEDPVGRIIKTDNKLNMSIGGVYEDLPHNSTFHDVKILLPWQSYHLVDDWVKTAETQWDNHAFQLFVQLGEGVNEKMTAAKIKDIPKGHVKEGKEELFLHSMNDWHLRGKFSNGKIAGGYIQYVKMLGAIGLFVLLLACINFINLSTARSEMRAKEVGIRKTMGSLRRQLIMQFLWETSVIVLGSLLVSLILVQLALPYFNRMADKQIAVPWTNIFFWLLLFLFLLITSLLAGSYPAFFLSRFEAIKALKGSIRTGHAGFSLRKILVVAQFTISVVLIIGTAVVYRQVNFAKNRDTGYSKDGLISIEINNPDICRHYNALRNDLLETGVVAAVSAASNALTERGTTNANFQWAGQDVNSNAIFRTVAVTHDYGQTVNWKIAQGRDFSRDFPTDTGAFIVNEAAAKLLGFKEPVGQTITWSQSPRRIVGVVKDMIMESPYEPAKPTIFFLNYNDNWISVLTVRIKNSSSTKAALDKIGGVFQQYDPNTPFVFKFNNEEYARKFFNEERIGNLITFFSVFALIISYIGLIGLASFVTERRTREMGVRKVMGASVASLWKLLSKEFVILVSLSCLIAGIISWYVAGLWLNQFAFRIEMSGWLFVMVAASTIITALLTVSYKIIRTAKISPVKSLKVE